MDPLTPQTSLPAPLAVVVAPDLRAAFETVARERIVVDSVQATADGVLLSFNAPMTPDAEQNVVREITEHAAKITRDLQAGVFADPLTTRLQDALGRED